MKPLALMVLLVGCCLTVAGCAQSARPAVEPTPQPGGVERNPAAAEVPWKTLAGTWHGVLEDGPSSLRLELTITDVDEEVTATWRNVDHTAAVIRVATLKLEGLLLTLTTTGPATSFVCAYVPAQPPYLVGTFSQNGQGVPLRLARGTFSAP